MAKIAISMTGKDMEEVREQLEEMSRLDFDVIEWRADYFFSPEVLSLIRNFLPDKELIFTLRSQREGGLYSGSDALWISHIETAMASGQVDYIDIEIQGMCARAPSYIQELKKRGMKMICSFHDFEKTPDKGYLMSLYGKMEAAGADIAKIAVMPKNQLDVDILISAARESGELISIPLIAISMGDLGRETRTNLDLTGSILTFGVLTTATAPGQIAAKELALLLERR